MHFIPDNLHSYRSYSCYKALESERRKEWTKVKKEERGEKEREKEKGMCMEGNSPHE